MVQSTQRVGVGVIARNDHGMVLKAQTTCIDEIFTTFVVELLAESLLSASKDNWTRVILETF